MRLCLFGGAGIVCAGKPVSGRIAHRHPLGLLAVLASERGVPVTRDKLAALLWPESDGLRARRRLRVTLHALRKALGADAIVSVGDALHLNETKLDCDLWAFDDALARGAREEAVHRYRGAFLDGFHLKGSVEFEKWQARKRDELAEQYREALDALTNEAEGEGSGEAAAKWLQLRAADDPYNERVVSRLLDLLARCGAREAALHHAEEYERRVREDLGIAPGAWLAERTEELRREPQDLEHAVRYAGSPPGDDSPATLRETIGNPPRDLPRAPEISPLAIPGPRSRSVRPAGRGKAAIVAGLGLTGLVAAGLFFAGGSWGAPDASEAFRGAIVVLPFEYSGAKEYAYLSGGVVDLLSRNVDAIPGLRAADPNVLRGQLEELPDHRFGLEEGRRVSDRLQAEAFVLGSILEAGGQLSIEATMYGVDAEVLGRASIRGSDSEMFDILDRLTIDLLADQVALTHSQVAGVAATTTGSLPALRAYLEGEGLAREHRLDEAAELFERALAEDSTFALAYYELAVVKSFQPVLGPIQRAEILDLAQQALEHSERLTWRDREMLRGFEAFRRFDLTATEAHLGAVLAEDPDDVEALYQLGEALLHINQKRGASPIDAGPLFERTVMLQPDHVFALRHLVDVKLMSHDRVATDTLVDRLEKLTPETAGPYRFVARWIAGSEVDRQRLLAEPTDLTTLQRAAELMMRTMRAMEDARRVLRRVVERTQDPAGPGWYTERGPPARVLAFEYLAYLDAAMGQRARASAHLDSAQAVNGRMPLQGRIALAFWPFLDLPRARGEAVLAATMALPAYHGRQVDTTQVVTNRAQPRYVAFYVAYLAARFAGTAQYEEALAVLQDIRAIADSVFPNEFVIYSPTSLQRAARAYPAFLEGRWSEVTDILLAPGPRTLPEENRWMLARALDESGRDEEALTWYGSFDREIDGPRGTLVPPYAPSHYYRGRIYEARGELERAALHYARFLEVWAAPDSSLLPMVRDGRRRLSELRDPLSAAR